MAGPINSLSSSADNLPINIKEEKTYLPTSLEALSLKNPQNRIESEITVALSGKHQLKDPSICTSLGSYITSKASWLGMKTFYGASWIAGKTAEYALFSSNYSVKEKNESYNELGLQTGCKEFGLLLSKMVPFLSEKIKNKTVGDGVRSSLFESEKGFLNNLLEILLGKIAVNIGKDLKKSKLDSAIEKTFDITPMDLVLHLGSIFQIEVKKLQQKLLEINEIKDEKAKNAARHMASQEAALSILKVLIPGGVQDLPLRAGLNNILWYYLKTKAVPDLMLDMANFSHELKDFSKTEELKQNPDMAVMVSALESCSSLISDQFDSFSDPSIATGVSKAILKGMSISEKTSELGLEVWLSNMLQGLSKNEDPLVIKFKSLRNSLIETLLSHVFYKLSQGVPKGSDPIFSILENLITVVNDFKLQYNGSINDVYEKLESKGSSPEMDPKYIDYFKPLSLKIIETLDLQNVSQFLPKAIRPFVETIEVEARDGFLPKILAKYYRELISPSAQLYQNVLNPIETTNCKELKLLEGGEFLSKQGVHLTSVILDELPGYLSENQDVIASFGKRKLVEVAGKIDQQIKNILAKKCDLEPIAFLCREEKLKRTFSFVEPWISRNLRSIGTSEDRKVLNAWKFIESRIDAIFAHSVRAIYKKNKGTANNNKQDRGISAEVLDTVFSVIDGFIELHGSNLQKRYAELCHLKLNPKDDKQFLEMFLPLTERLYETFGFDDLENLPIPDIFKPFLKNIIMDALPIFFARRYHEILVPQETIANAKLQLEKILTSDHSDQTAAKIEQVDNISDILADKISNSLIKSLSDLTFEGFLNGSAGSVSDAAKQFNNRYLKNIVKSLLIQAIVNYLAKLKTGPQDGGLISSGIMKFGLVIKNRLIIDAEKLERTASIKDLKLQKEAIAKAFIPMSKELCKLFSSEEIAENSAFSLILPFQNVFKGSFDLIESKLLPNLLADLYLDKKSWKGLIELNQSEVLSRPNGHYIPESCRVIASYVGSLLPVVLYRDQELIAETVFNAAKKYLREIDNPKGLSVEEYLKENETLIKKTFCFDLTRNFTPGAALGREQKPITQEYVELLLLKFFEGVSKRIFEKEGNLENQDDFLVNLSIKLLSTANMHFKTINKASGKRQAYEVSHAEFLREFLKEENGKVENGEKLFPGIPKSLASLAADKKITAAMRILDRERARYDRLRNPDDKLKSMEKIKAAQKALRDAKSVQEVERQAFFKPLSEFLLEVSGMSDPKDFPFPKPLQDEVFNLVKNTLLPAMVGKIYESILSPATINSMMQAGLVALNESLDAVPDPNAVITEVPKDEKQQKLNKVCGELILELLQQIPESYTRIILKIDKLKKFTTEAVGEAVRRQLGENLTLAKIIENGLVSGLPHLCSGKWDLRDGRMMFIPGKWEGTSVDPKFIPDPILQDQFPNEIMFSFAMTDDQLEAAERKKMRQNKLAENKMKNLMVKTTHRLTSDAFFYSLKAPFLYFLNLWNKAVDYVFGKYAPKVREFIKYNGESFIFRMLESFFSLAYKAVTYVPWFFIDFHNSIKVEYFTRNMHLKIHENLLVGLTNELMEALSNKESAPADNIFESIMKLAEARDLEAEKERLAYLKHWKLNEEE